MSDSEIKWRFRVAFSFAGEKRRFVAETAEILAKSFGKEAILYDKFHEAEFARSDLGIYLPKLYRSQSDLIVPIICKSYSEKLWTGWEWDQIFVLLNRDDRLRVMPCRFDKATCDGLSPACGYIDLDDKTPGEFVQLILERLARNEGKSRDHYLTLGASSDDSCSPSNDSVTESTVRATTSASGLPTIEAELGHTSASSWFSQRFKRAFPGVRNEVCWIDDPDEAIHRLLRLLEAPLVYNNFEPAWWFRGGSTSAIREFRLIGNHTVLMDSQELEIEKVAAIDCGQYWNHTVYVQVKGVPPSGADQAAIDHHASIMARMGYCDEEVCLFRGQYLRRTFHDDGAAEIDGKLVDFNGESEVRTRYLSPYNFLISGHDSAVNNEKFDRDQEELMNRALNDPKTVETLAQRVSKLPKQVWYERS